MSEIPPFNETIISELYGYKWDDNYDSQVVEAAIHQVLNDRQDLSRFCERMRQLYWSEADCEDTPPSWRDFRNLTIEGLFKQKFDKSEIIDEIEKEIEAIRDNNPNLDHAVDDRVEAGGAE